MFNTDNMDTIEESTGTGVTTAPLDSNSVDMVTQAPQVITINDLISVREALLVKENADRQAFLSTFQPSDETLRASLVTWATMGFPPQSVLASVQLDPPPKCSDGETRTFFYYGLYLAGIPDMTPLMTALEVRVEGMDFDFVLKDSNTFNLIVSKTA